MGSNPASLAPAWSHYLTFAWPPFTYRGEAPLPDVAVYDLEHQPTTFNFVPWCLMVKNLGAKEVRFAYEGKIQDWKYSPSVAWRRFANILIPTCELFGLPWSIGNRCPGFTVGYELGHVQELYRALPAWQKLKLTDEPRGHVTVTIRDSIRNKFRDSNMREWERVIAQIEKTEKVVVLEDSETLGGVLSIEKRMRLYSGAKMNLHVNNGPMGLCYASDAPYLAFMNFGESQEGKNLVDYMVATAFPPGSQLDFRTPKQAFVWADDTFDTIMAAYVDVMGSQPVPQAAPAEKPVAPANWPTVPIEALVQGRTANLTIHSRCVVDNTERYAQCEKAKQSGFPILSGCKEQLIEGPCVLVGSGPSAIPLLPEIRARYERGEEIIAIKGAHDWLVANGIMPKAAMALDPQQSRAKCFKNPQGAVLYLCASQMHPDTWMHLAGRRVLVWHSRIEAEQEKVPGWERAFLIPCCSTTGNSAIALMYILGRRNFHLYGFDSSIPPVTSAWQRLVARFRGRLLKLDGMRVPREKQVFEVTVGGHHFQTTPELVSQATELQPLLQYLEGIKVEAYGHGYYQALLAHGKTQGWPV